MKELKKLRENGKVEGGLNTKLNEESNNLNCNTVSILLPYLEELIALLSVNSTDHIIDETEFCNRFHVSRRTTKRWRDAGLKFSQPTDKKIFYKLQWIEEFLDKNSFQGF